MASMLGAGLNSNLLEAAQASGLMAAASAATSVLESVAPQTAAGTAVNLSFADLTGKTPTGDAATQAAASSANAASPEPATDSAKKLRWEGRANACLKAVETWEEKVSGIVTEVQTIKKAAEETLQSFEGAKSEGVGKWLELVRLRIAGCQAWLDGDVGAIKKFIVTVYDDSGAVKLEDGSGEKVPILDSDGKLKPDIVDTIRHKLPCTDFDELVHSQMLIGMADEYDDVASAEELKQKKLDHQAIIDKVRVLVNQTKSSVSDLTRARASKETKAQRAVQKEQNERIKAAAKAEAAAKARAKKRQNPGVLQATPIFRFSVDMFTPIATHETPEAFVHANEEAKVDPSLPYIVSACKELACFGKGECQHKETVDAMLGAFAGSQQERSHGRGVIYIKADDYMDKMAQLAPGLSMQIPEGVVDEKNHSRLNTLSIFAFSAKMTYIGTELLDMGCLRMNLVGARRVVVCAFSRVAALTKAALKMDDAAQVKVDDVRSYLEDISEEDLSELIAAQPDLFLAAIVDAGSMMYLPAGWFIVDSTTSASIVHGVRRTVILQTAAGSPDVKSLVAALEAEGAPTSLKAVDAHLQKLAGVDSVDVEAAAEALADGSLAEAVGVVGEGGHDNGSAGDDVQAFGEEGGAATPTGAAGGLASPVAAAAQKADQDLLGDRGGAEAEVFEIEEIEDEDDHAWQNTFGANGTEPEGNTE